jgi:hypothetical protein
MKEKPRDHNKGSKFLLLQALFVSLLTVVVFAIRDRIEEKFTILLMPFVFCATVVVFAGSFTFSIRGIIKHAVCKSKNGLQAIMALNANLLAVCIVVLLLVLPSSAGISSDFRENFDKMNVVVKQIVGGTFETKGSNKVFLPEAMEEISADGYVTLLSFENQVAIYFCTNPGLLDFSEGYVFLTEDIDSAIYPDENFRIKEDLGDNWYFCSTY